MENIEMKRLYFRKSKNKSGKDCYIAKVKEYVQEEGKAKKHIGDLIVIANMDRCNIDKSGRWDVIVSPMKNGKGYLVSSAIFTLDVLTHEIDWNENEVLLLVNGEETKLKREGKGVNSTKFFPLSFQSARYYPIDRLLENIKEKANFLQLDSTFSLPNFLEDFGRACEAVHSDYQKNQNYGTPNTPFKEAFENLKK